MRFLNVLFGCDSRRGRRFMFHCRLSLPVLADPGIGQRSRLARFDSSQGDQRVLADSRSTTLRVPGLRLLAGRSRLFLPPPAAGTPPCKRRNLGCNSRRRLRSECSRDYMAINQADAGSNPVGSSISWGRSSTVERYVSTILVAALTSLSVPAVVVQKQNPGLPARGYGCNSRPPLRSNAGGTTW